MSRRWATIFFLVVLLISAVSVIRVWLASRSESDVVEVAEPDVYEPVPVEEELETKDVVLYFPSTSDDLAPEIRALAEVDEIRVQVAMIVRALLIGPEDELLLSPLPEGVQLGGVYLGSLGVVYVDLRSEMARPPATGSRTERLIVGSLVESVLANCPELEAVVLLWNGVQPDSFSGHLDTSRPLRGGIWPIATTP